MHYHLDPVGGIAGDMFAAAMLDYHRDWKTPLAQAVRDSGLALDLEVQPLAHNDGILAGHSFRVREPSRPDPHRHHRWRDVRNRLAGCELDTPVKERAIAIFRLLAEAEAEVHGSAVDEVTFHEVGAWDSIADIVSAAWLIEQSGASSWSCSPLPLGRGRITSAHGWLPVPAPATVVLLKGFPVFDDGVEGERITPTGAAIMKHLEPSFSARMMPSVLLGCGYGFGTRKFREFSNVLMVSIFDPRQTGVALGSVVVCQFEVDDQTPEDLAVGLDRLRELAGVYDVTQSPVFGKKGRISVHIQVLGQVSQLDRIIEHCLTETTTLGVRWHRVSRTTLARDERSHQLAGDEVRVKRTTRPGGTITRKVEMADLARAAGGHAGREQRRREAHAYDLSDDDKVLTSSESGQ